MSVNLTINGASYSFPNTSDENWGDNVTNWATAVSNHLLQKTGGAFTLTNEIDFGASFGLKSLYYKSRGTNVANTGVVRLANTEAVSWRDAGNANDLALSVNASDVLTFNGTPLVTGTSGVVDVAHGGTNITSYTAGDTLYATGATTLAKLAIGAANKVLTSTGSAPAWNLIVNANIDAAAAVTRSKLASGTANHVIINDGSGVMSSEATLSPTRGGTGISNNASSTLTISGAFATTLTVTGATGVTLPTTGTLATLAGTETLTNKTLTGNIAVNLVSGAATITLPTVTGTLATLAGTETFTNKTLTEPTINDVIFQDISTPSTPSSGYRKLYSKSDGKFYQKDSAGNESQIGGASAGGINYILNPDGETAVTGYNAYADAAGTAPVDGTGGSPTVTITRATGVPLRGAADINLSKPASNIQGQGMSYDFTIANSDLAKPLTISFEYRPSSTNFVAGSDTALGDLVVYVYDITNTTIIQPTPYKLTGGYNGGTTGWKYSGTFQTAINSTSYRLIWHFAGTGTTAYSIDFDNISVGPQVQLYGAPISEWKNFTPTLNSTTNVSVNEGEWRRVGDCMEIKGAFQFSGAGASALVSFIPPTGYSVDTAKIINNTGFFYCGTWGWYDASGSAASRGGFIYYSGPGFLFLRNDTSANADMSSFAASDRVSYEVSVPITGWGSNTLMSSDADTRVVSFRARKTSGSHTSSGSYQDVASWDILEKDSHGAFNATTGVYTAPISGYYQVSGQLDFTQNATGSRGSLLGGTGWTAVNSHTYGTHIAGTTAAGVYNISVFNHTIYCNAGDTIKALGYQASGGTLTYSSDPASIFQISRVSGPSAIAASETVACHAQTGASQSITNAGTYVTVVYGTRVFDTHLALNTSTGVFTCPSAGRYLVHANCLWNNVTWTQANFHALSIFKNGVEVCQNYYSVQATVAYFPGNTVTAVLNCNAGDTIDIRAANTRAGGASAFNSGPQYNHMSIARIGI